MTIAELHAQLTQLIAAGKGDRPVVVYRATLNYPSMLLDWADPKVEYNDRTDQARIS